LTSVDSKNLTLNAFTRAKIGFLYNTEYNFTVTATTDNPYKASVTSTITVKFSAPTANDYKTNPMSSSCDSISATNDLYFYSYNSTYSKTLKFDIANYTNVFNNLVTISSTGCKNGTVTN
jgi:hypothetical protein